MDFSSGKLPCSGSFQTAEALHQPVGRSYVTVTLVACDQADEEVKHISVQQHGERLDLNSADKMNGERRIRVSFPFPQNSHLSLHSGKVVLLIKASPCL